MRSVAVVEHGRNFYCASLPARRRDGRRPTRMQSTPVQQEVSDTFNWMSSRRISSLAHSDSARLLNGEATPSAKPR
ncbi:hypothetical protein CDO26_18190 (plasmid) [Sinorhizobium meliloti]|nr:hypothetical protein CDO26_18190 [Sinorhizobium meliloti]ASP93589.1 hypothetical protein CDO25_20820 [Sinorhizobium meliloti]RVG77875.1 hypothetical protein CN219_29310 [Sinorhizobium meliloti]RVI38369.1 hypothetical protein CN197_05400 [Sinorhizobium meliloti]RVI43392.1 hypothetical protein CN196_18870 [Sinorhizobium meliloti]